MRQSVRLVVMQKRPMAPIALEEFDSSAGWSFGGTAGGSGAFLASPAWSGSSLRLTANNSAGANYTATKSVAWDLSAGGLLVLWLNVVDRAFGNIQIYLSSANFAGSKYLNKNVSLATYITGPQFIMFDLSEFTASGGESIANLITQVRVRIDSSNGGQFHVDHFAYVPPARKRKPSICFQFDDGYSTQYTEAFSYMSTKGMKGSVMGVEDFVGAGGFATLLQLQEMYAAGWDICNHTKAHVAFNAHTATGVATSQTPAASFTIDGSYAAGGVATLDAPRHIVFTPSGNEGGKAFTVTGKLAGVDKSEVIYGLNGTKFYTSTLFDEVSAITIGTAATAAITVGTSVTQAEAEAAVGSVTTYLEANGMPRAAKHFAYPQGEFNPSTDAALAAQGIITARTVLANTIATQVGVPTPLKLPTFPLSTGVTQAAAKAYVDLAILRGASVFLYAHRLGNGGTGIDWPVADFQALVDYVATKRDAGLVDVVTTTEFYWSRMAAAA